MKIFYIAHFDCTTEAGNASHVRGVVHELEKQGHDVWLFASGWEQQRGGRIRFVPVPQVRIPGLYALSFGLFCWMPFLAQCIKIRPQVAYMTYFKLLVPVVLVARLLRVLLVVEVNSDLANERCAARQGRMQQRIENWIEGWTYRRVQGIVVVAQGIERSIRSRFPRLKTGITVISNGADLDIFFPQDQLTCRRRLGLEPHCHYVAFVGAFQSWQGLPTLVEAAACLVRSVPNTVFLLVGDGPERRRVQELVAQHGVEKAFLLVGPRAPREAADYIGASDVCVAPYDRSAASLAGESGYAKGAPLRGSPMKIYTYLSCGRPVVATHFQEAGEFVHESDAGLSVPPDDPRALAEAIEALLHDPHLTQQMGQRGRRIVEQGNSWAAVTRKIVDYLQHTAQSHARG